MQMIRRFLGIALCAFVTHSLSQIPQGAYLDGKNSKVAVILAYGQGLDPDANVVGPLRLAIHTELGFHTLSLSMPTLPGSKSLDLFEDYASTFPDAYVRIQAAIDFLRKEKGVERIYLMGRSMGGRMTSAFLANNPDAPIVGFIGIGLLAGGKEPLNTNLNLRKIMVPVPGAKHDYRGYEKFVADAVNGWLKKQEGK